MGTKARGRMIVEMTGDEHKLWTSQQKIVQQQKQMEAGYTKVGRASERSGNQAKRSMGTVAMSGVKTLLGGLVGVGGVLAVYRLITAEMRQQINLQKAAADAQMPLNQARQVLIRNLYGLRPEQIATTLTVAGGIARETKVSEKWISLALAQAVSASGGQVDIARQTVRQAAKFLTDTPEQIPEYAGSLLDVLKGVLPAGADAPAAQGYLQSIGALSRIVSPQRQARNIPPALVGMMGYGATAQEAGALFAAATTAAKDPLGEQTRTATIAFAQQLEAILPKLKTMGERIEYLQKRPGLAGEFAEGLKLEKRMLVPLRDLIADAASVGAQQYAVNLGKMPGLAGMRQAAGQAITNRMIDPLEATAIMKRQFAVTTEELLTTDIAGGMASVIREGLQNALRAGGEGALALKFSRGEFELLSGLGRARAVKAAVPMLEQEIREREAPYEWQITGRYGARELRHREPTERELQEAGVFRELIEEIRALPGRIAAATGQNRSPTLAAAPNQDLPANATE